MPRPPLLKGGGGGGAEVLCFIPLPVEELLLGREMSGSDGRWERCCSDGDGLVGGEGELERPVGGRGAAGRAPGGRRADLPTEPQAEPSPTGRNFGTPPWKSPPIPIGPPPPKPPPPPPPPPLPPPPPPPDFSITGALRSLTTPTFFSLAPLWMSDSSAPLPFASDEFSLGGVVFA